jgi:hypothetical protein
MPINRSPKNDTADKVNVPLLEEFMSGLVKAVDLPGCAMQVQITHGRDMDVIPFLFELLANGIRVSSLTANTRDFVLHLRKMPPSELERFGKHDAYFASLLASYLQALKSGRVE